MKSRINTLSSDIVTIKNYTIDRLLKRGVHLEDIAVISLNYLKNNKNINTTLDDCMACLLEILDKRETLHKIILGIDIDEIAEQQLFKSPIFDVIRGDDGLFGVDELFGINIADLYGAIGYSTFGYFDKTKPGIINNLDTSDKYVNTFLDDIVCGLAAAITSKLVHSSICTTNLLILKNKVLNNLKELNISTFDIAQIVYDEQIKYNSNLNIDLCEKFVESIISKREVLNKLTLCLFLNNSDEYIQNSSQFLDDSSRETEDLFGINKQLGLSISELYGAIGYSNYGYFCETSPGIISKLRKNELVSIFLIDAICGVAAAASGKIAHYYRGDTF